MRALNVEPKHSYMGSSFEFLSNDEQTKLSVVSVDDDGDIRFSENTSNAKPGRVAWGEFSAHEKMKMEEVVAKIREAFDND